MILPMIREITIKPVLNGFVCKVGCQTVVFGDTETLSRQIKAYYDNPDATEKTYIANAVNRMSEGPQCAPEPAGEDMATPTNLVRNVVERNVGGDCCENVRPTRR